LKEDKEFIIEAIKQDVNTFQFASDKLKDDKEFVIEAVKKKWNCS